MALGQFWRRADTGPGFKVDKLRRNMVHEPHVVGGTAKDMPGAVHRAGQDHQNDRLSVTGTDLAGRDYLLQQVHVMPFHLEQALFSNALEKTPCRAVIQNFGRRLRRVFQVHRDGMTLIGANKLTVVAECKPLFIAGGDDVSKLVNGERRAVLVQG